MNETLFYPDSSSPGGRFNFPLHILPFATGNFIGGCIVCLFNLTIVVATICSKNLRGNCNILIGVLAATDFVTGLCFIQQSMMIFLGEIYFSRRTCSMIWSILFFSMDAGSGLILAVGFDRFTSLTFPIWYKSLNRKLYFGVITGICGAYGLSVSLFGVLSQRSDSLIVTCIPPTALSRVPFYYWIFSNLIINISVVAIYVLAFLRAKSLRDNELLSSAGREVSRKTELKHNLMVSLVIVMVVYIFSWLATIAIVGFVRSLDISRSARFHVTAYCGWLVLVNVGSNFVIYFTRSDLYRNEILKMFRCGSQDEHGNRLATVPLIPNSHVHTCNMLNPNQQCYGASNCPCNSTNHTALSPMMYENRAIASSPSHCTSQNS